MTKRIIAAVRSLFMSKEEKKKLAVQKKQIAVDVYFKQLRADVNIMLIEQGCGPLPDDTYSRAR